MHWYGLAALALIAASLAAVGAATRAHAANCIWQGDDVTNPTLWSDADNWSCGNVPLSTDTVTFDGTAVGTTVVIDGSGTLTVAGWSQTSAFTGTIYFSVIRQLVISNGGNFNVDGGTFEGRTGQAIPGGGTSVVSGTISIGTSGTTSTATIDGGTVNLAAATTINGSYAQTAGTVNATGNTVITSNFTQSGGTFAHTASNLRFQGGAATIDVVPASFTAFNLEFGQSTATNGLAKTIADGDFLTATGASTIVDGRVVQATPVAGGAVRVAGNLTINSNSDSGSTALFVLNGTGTQAINGQGVTPAGAYGFAPPIQINKSAGTTTIGNRLRTDNDFEIVDPGTSLTSSAAAHELIITGSPTITIPSTLASGESIINNVTIGDSTTPGTPSLADGTELRVGNTLKLENGGINVTTQGVGTDGTVGLPGVSTNGADTTVLSTYDGGNALIEIDGVDNQTITTPATAPADLNPITINKPTSGNLTLATASGQLRLGAGKAWTHTAVAGTYDPGTVTFFANGNSFAGSPTFQNLTLEANSSLSNGGTLRVNNTLALDAFTLSTTSTGTIYVPTASGVTRSSGYVQGRLRHDITATGATTFHVGTASGYTPILTDFSAHTAAGQLTATSTNGDHSDLAASSLDPTQSANRFWTLEGTTLRGTYDATFTFLPGDLDGGADTSTFAVGKRNGAWTSPTVGTRTATSTQATGIALSADGSSAFAVGELGIMADGGGTMSAGTSNVSASQTGRTIVFTYTAGGTMTDGEVRLSVPTGWTAPVNSAGNPGHVTATSTSDASISVTPSGQNVVIGGLTLATGNTVTITYGAGAGGGATATSSTGAQEWTTASSGTNDASFSNLATSPSVTVNAADGSGTMAAALAAGGSTLAGTANEYVFTYTAPTGGLNNGAVTVAIPAGWTNPQFVSTNPGYTTASADGDAIVPGFDPDTRILTVSGVTLLATEQLVITYGNDSGNTVPAARAVSPGGASSGPFTFTTQQRSTAGGTLTTLTSGSPSLTTTNSADGSGTPSGPASVARNATLVDVAFSYLADTGGMKNGEIEITVPASWSDPTTSGGVGHISSTAGTPSVFGDVITVAGVSLNAGQSVTITYNDVTTPDEASGQFAFRQKSTSGGGFVATTPANVTVNLVAPPNTPALVSPAADSWTNDTTPDLVATFSDPDAGNTGTIHFRVCDAAAAAGVQCTTLSTPAFSSSAGIVNGQNGTGTSGALAQGDHFWQARAEDNTGALSGWSATRRIRVDTAAPTQTITLTGVSTGGATGANDGQGAEAFLSGTTIFYRGVDTTGSFQIQSDVTDALSGGDSASFTFPADALGFDFPATETVGTPDPGPYVSSTVTWNGGTNTGTIGVQSADKAANTTATANLTLTDDSADPTGAITAPGALEAVRGSSVAVSSDSADSGAGVRSAQFFFCNGASCDPFAGTSIGTDTTAPYSVTWDTTAGVSDGDKRVGVRTIDRVGNVFQSVERQITVDNTVPTEALTLTGVGTDIGFFTAIKVGSTVFYRGTADSGRSFTITSAVNGTGSDPIDSVFTLTAGGSFGIAGGSPQTVATPLNGPFVSGAITWNDNETASSTLGVVSHDDAGNASAGSSLTFTNDSTAPTPTAPTCDSVACGGAGVWYDNAQDVVLAGTDATGAVTVRYTTNGVDPTTTTGTLYNDAFPISSATTIEWIAIDPIGNATTVQTLQVNVDMSAPPTPTVDLTAVSNVSVDDASRTVIFGGNVAGSFTIAAASTDPESGATTFTFPASLGSGWSITGTTATSRTYSFTSSAVDPTEPLTITATNPAGLNSSQTFTVTVDDTAPTVGTPQCDGSACGGAGVWYDNAQDVTFPGNTDATPGGTTVYYTTDGSDPTTASATAQPLAVSTATTIKWIVVDAVGNPSAVQTLQVNVDTSAPPAPTLTFTAGTNTTVDNGTRTVVFNGTAGGSFTVAAASTDPQSGATTYTFPTGGDLGVGWSVSGSGASRTYTFTGTAVDPTEPITVTATNPAGLSAAQTFTVTEDETAPTITVQCNTGGGPGACSGTYTSTVTVTATAPGSTAIRYTTDGSTPTTSSTAFPGGGVPISATTTFKIRAWDAVNNFSDVTATVNVDTAKPVLSSSALGGGGNSVVLTFSESLKELPPTAAGAFEVSVAGSPRTVNTVVISGATVTLTFSGAPATASQTVHFAYLKNDPINPIEDLNGHEADAIPSTLVGGTGGPPPAGPSSTDAPESTVTFSSTPAAVTESTSATFAFSAPSAVSYECSTDGGAFAACSSPVTVSSLSEGTHRFEVRAVRIGGLREKSAAVTWRIDRTGPSAPTKVDGPGERTVDTGPHFTFSHSESGVSFVCRVDDGTFSGCMSPKHLENLSYGTHTFEVRAVDEVGNSGSGAVWTFEVIPAPNGDTSTTEIKGEETEFGQPGSVTTPDGSATLAWPSEASPSDALLMTISEPQGLAVNTGAGMVLTALVDASAYRLSSGENVTEFGGASVVLTIDAPAGPLVVYTSPDGGATWELIPFITGPGLDAGLRHGAIREPGKVVILTRHLSLFALVGDTQAPSTPVLAGDVRAEGLRLSWQPSKDNSGQVARYVLLIDGSPSQAFGAATTETIVSGFGPDDRRSFQIVAEDNAGNRSAPSAALRSVPALTGMTLDEARAALEARGLILGATTVEESPQPSGTVIGQAPGTPGVLAAGSSVELVVSRGQAPSARLVMRVATAATLPLAKRRTISVRLQVTKRADVVAVLRSPQGQPVATWKRRVRAGVTILKFRLPTAVRRTGTYTLAISAAGIGDRQRVVKRIKIRIVGQGAAAMGPAVNPPRTRVEIVLAGGSAQARRLLNLQSSYRVQAVGEISDAFDRASSGTTRANVIVIVDVSSDGVEVVRHFRQVLPDVRVVAVVDPSHAAAARAAGAAATVAPSASDSQLRRAIARLLVSA